MVVCDRLWICCDWGCIFVGMDIWFLGGCFRFDVLIILGYGY